MFKKLFLMAQCLALVFARRQLADESENDTVSSLDELGNGTEASVSVTSEDVTTNTLADTEPPVIEDDVNGVPEQLSDDRIVLQRNNCHSEIGVDDNTDVKLTVEFGRLQNNSYGRCCLIVTGSEGTTLGVLISDVHLYRNSTEGEVLKVIIGDRHSAFLLKEYHGSNNYEPLLLTEARRVYIMLYYRVGYVPATEDGSHFNLEVFTYQRRHHAHAYPDEEAPYYARAGAVGGCRH